VRLASRLVLVVAVALPPAAWVQPSFLVVLVAPHQPAVQAAVAVVQLVRQVQVRLVQPLLLRLPKAVAVAVVPTAVLSVTPTQAPQVVPVVRLEVVTAVTPQLTVLQALPQPFGRRPALQ
jgi:hypothetical protein